MRIISPTKLQVKKLKEMIFKLFPEYSFIWVRKNTISLSKSFWHFIIGKVERTSVAEMCTVYIPERLDKLYYKTFKDNDEIVYHRAYNGYSHEVLELLHHRSKSVIDYLYDEYCHVKYGLRRIVYTKRNMLPEITYTLKEILSNPIKKDALVLSSLSNVYARQSLKYWKDTCTTLVHPKLLSNYLNLWFKKEIKEKLQEFYQLKISVAA